MRRIRFGFLTVVASCGGGSEPGPDDFDPTPDLADTTAWVDLAQWTPIGFPGSRIRIVLGFIDPANWSCGDCIGHELRRYRRTRVTANATPVTLWASAPLSLYAVPER
jgi:hypothetical protein